MSFLDQNPVEDLDDRAINSLVQRSAWLRALHIWFHGAHHVVRGTSFAGDHASLYDRIYTAIQDEVDGAVEKVIGLTGSVVTACPKILTTRALEIMEDYQSPAELTQREIAITGLRMERDYIDFVERIFEELEEAEMLGLGLNDQLAASASAHETFVYLLQQRAAQAGSSD